MFHTFEELNAWLGQRCRALWRELLHPQYNGLTVAEVLEPERVEIMPMPTAFDGYVERTVRGSSTCWISMARNCYSMLCERVGQWVSSRLYPSRIVVIADETMIASHERLFDRDQVSFDWQRYIPLIERKPGALRNGAPFADLPNPLRLLKRGLKHHSNGDRKKLRLHGMAQAWEELAAQGEASTASSKSLLEHLLQQEQVDRAVRSVNHQMNIAKLPMHRDVAGFDFSASSADALAVSGITTHNK